MSLDEVLYKAYWRCERVIAPGLQYAQTIYEESLKEYSAQDSHWLDLGCGHQLLPPWRKQSEDILVSRAQLIVGIDPDYPSLLKHHSIQLRVCGTSSWLPFADQSFSLVTANMVMEHIEEPQPLMAEIWRVIRPGGVFVFHTPNSRGYATLAARMLPEPFKLFLIRVLERRAAHDVFPTWYRVNTADAITRHARSAGFEVESIKQFMTTAALATVLPLAVFELILIRILMSGRMAKWRTNIIAVLRKPGKAS